MRLQLCRMRDKMWEMNMGRTPRTKRSEVIGCGSMRRRMCVAVVFHTTEPTTEGLAPFRFHFVIGSEL